MLGQDSSREPLEVLADEFLTRRRGGETPSIADYTTRHPEFADQIRELFPTLMMLEEGCADSDGDAGDAAIEATGVEGIENETLGNYRLLRPIGRGGMGVVFEAIQEPLGRHVALKVFPANRWGDGSHRERFRREAQVAARLHHTNIVPVFDVGEDNGVDYYAMQFIDGHGLDQIIRQVRLLGEGEPETNRDIPVADHQEPVSSVARSSDPMRLESAPDDLRAPRVDAGLKDSDSLADSSVPPDSGLASSSGRSDAPYYHSVATIGVQVAEALAYAHQQGVLHRDIKPSNLLLDIENRVWVADFGLAKSTDSDELTQPGDVVGTLQYMAPERFDRVCDHRSDVYGLGVTLYELLTRQPAFSASDRARLVQLIATAEPIAPRKLEPGIPRDLETIVLKAIDKDPETRFQSATELAEDLRHYLADRPVNARRTPPWEKFWRWCRRNPVVSTLSISLGMLMIAVAAGSAIFAAKFDDEKRAAQDAWIAEQAARENAIERLWESYYAQAQAGRHSRQAGQSFDVLAALTEAARIRPDLSLRNEAIAYLAKPDFRTERQWDGIRFRHIRMLPDVVDFDTELEQYAREDLEGVVSVRRVSDDAELFRLPAVGKRVVEVRFSPGARYLAVEYVLDTGYEVHVWELTTQRRVLQVLDTVGMGNVAFNPDETLIAFGQWDGTTSLFNLSSGETVVQFEGEPSPIAVRFDEGGQRLAITRWGGQITQTWDVTTRELIYSSPSGHGASCVSWRPDGRVLAASGNGVLYLYDLAAGDHSVVNARHDYPQSVAFHPDAQLLVTSGLDGMTRLWDSLSGHELLSADGRFIRFSSDGSRLAFQDGSTLGIWDVSTGDTCRRLDAGDGFIDSIADVCFSADGRLMAAAAGSAAYLWETERFLQVGTIPLGNCRSVFFHPADGSLLTSGIDGLQQHILETHGGEDGISVEIDHPVRLSLSAGMIGSALFNDRRHNAYCARISGDGRVVAVAFRSSRQVQLLDVTDNRNWSLAGRCRDISVSPDGQWVAGSDHHEALARVWNVDTGELVHEVTTSTPHARVAFSPDDHWLVVSDSEEFSFWDVGGWRQSTSIPRRRASNQGGAIAFSADGTVAALTHSRYDIQLINVATGQELATLEPFDSPDTVQSLCFSPDGTKLVAACGADGLRVWDLSRIREHLSAMGLDWATPMPFVEAD